MKHFHTLFFSILFITFSSAQIEKERKMHRLISTPTGDELAPSLTPDGNTMIFMKKTTSSKHYHIHITTKSKGQWSRPIDIPSLNKHSSMLMLGGYAISPDGTEIIYTTKKHPSVGGYDLWSSKKTGTTWGEPSNIGAPLNSKNNEGMPSFSADGKTLYFIRGNISHHRLSGEVFMSKRNKKGLWITPKKVITPTPITQAQVTATGTHLLLNDSKNIFYYNIKAKTSSSPILKDPYTFYSIYYKHDILIYSKDVDKMFDIYEAKIKTTKNTPRPVLSIKHKNKIGIMLNVYDTTLNICKQYMSSINDGEIITMYYDHPVYISISNKKRHFAVEKVTLNTKSKTHYNRLKNLLEPTLLNDTTLLRT